MNAQYYQTQIYRIEKEIADLQKKLADESKKEYDKQKQIDSVNRSITKSTSLTTLKSKQQQISGYNKNILDIQKKKTDIQKNIASKTQELGRKRQELQKAEETERKKIQKEQLDFQQKLQRDISEQKNLLSQLINTNYSASKETQDSVKTSHKQCDFFISHATEDKEEIVRPLAEAIECAGFKVWYDEFSLTWGDSLREKIDEGLRISRYGIVIFSSNFFQKRWTNYELNGLVTREMDGHKVILPIWHKVTKDEVMSYSPSLADKLALNTSLHSIDEIVEQLKNIIHINKELISSEGQSSVNESGQKQDTKGNDQKV
jgi:hypothetical protein